MSAVVDYITPDAVRKLASGLSKTQRKFVLAGTFHGDFTMGTVRALRSRGLFYHHASSPNGRCGPMRLTALGEAVRSQLMRDNPNGPPLPSVSGPPGGQVA